MSAHLAGTPAEVHGRGWQEVDLLLVTGDPHLDHPAFAAALLGRLAEANGYRVALAARPDPEAPEALAAFGRPRLAVGVTGGALDSMVANYTPLKKRRRDDPYAPGGLGQRPDRALTVYTNLVRRAFGKDVLVVAGGLEASLRRFSHYDYWSDSVRRSILLDCGADLLVYGPGEAPLLELLAQLDRAADGESANRDQLSVSDLPGAVWYQPASQPRPEGVVVLPSHEEVAADKASYARAHALQERHTGEAMAQECAGRRVIANAPAPVLSRAALDRLYELPYTRDPHPAIAHLPVPALTQVRFSVTSHRGCAGGCSFCAITAHQGKEIVSRSRESVLREVRTIVQHPEFRGTVPDIGGPTANLWGAACTRPEGPCQRPSCLWPSRCRHFATAQEEYRNLLAEASRIPGVKHLFVTTGIRMDVAGDCPAFERDLALRYTSGHLKVAPEHTAPAVLAAMRKPETNGLVPFLTRHRRISRAAGRRQYVLPYLMAAHPGCRLTDMVDLALLLRQYNVRVEQCQIFTPTPGTTATAMYCTGQDPATGKTLYVERDGRRKQLQKALILYHRREHHRDIREALRLCGREEAAETLLGRGGRG